MLTKVREGGQGIGPLIGLLPQADRLQHRHHHVVLLLHNRQRYLEVWKLACQSEFDLFDNLKKDGLLSFWFAKNIVSHIKIKLVGHANAA